MKIRDLLNLCEDDYCSISVYDKFSFERKLFRYTQEVIKKYGSYTLLSWKIENGILKITIKTQF